MNHYPPIRLGLVNGLLQLKEDFERDPTLFQVSDCPYDPDVVKILVKLFATRSVEKIVERVVEVQTVEKPGRGRPKKGTVSGENAVDVEDEVEALIKELKELKGTDRKDPNTEIQILKTRAGLVEKMISMRERVFNIKRTSNFMEVVIRILDDCVSEDMRATFLKQIAPYRSGV